MNEYSRIFSLPKNKLVYNLNRLFLFIFCLNLSQIFKERRQDFWFFKIFHVRLANFHFVEGFFVNSKAYPLYTPEYQNKNVLKNTLKISSGLYIQLVSCGE